MSKNKSVGETLNQVYEPTQADKFMDSYYQQSANDINYIKGRILTIVDATNEDIKKREAVKDLVEQAFIDFWNRHHDINNELEYNIKLAVGEKPWNDFSQRPTLLHRLTK